MMYKTDSLFISVLLPALFCNAVMAEDDGEADTVQTDTYVVEGKYLSIDKITSIKTPTPIIDVPQSLSITTRDEIIKRGFTSIENIIDYTPGVNMSQGEGHRDAIVFRGVRSTADFYVDGLRDDVQYYRSLYNVEQVEILRGPNALLFGRGGTGGILNRVFKKAVIDDQFIAYRGYADTYAEHAIELDGNYSFNDRAAVRLNLMYEGLDNHRDFYDGDRWGFNPTFRFQATPVTTFNLSYEYINHDRFVDRGIPTGTNGEPVDAFEDITFGDEELNISDLEAHVVRLDIEHEFLENLKGVFNVQYGDYDKQYQNFYASAYDQANTQNVVTIDGYVDKVDRQTLTLQGNLVGEFRAAGADHTLLVGAEYVDTSSDQFRFNAFWTPDGNADSDTELFTIRRPLNFKNGVGINSAGTPVSNSFTADLNDDTRVDIETYSVYFQDQIEFSSIFQVVFGLRYDNFDIEVNNVDPGAGANFGVRTNRDEEISPRAGLIFKPWGEDISIYASYSKTFLPRSGEQFDSINGEANLLDADEFETQEIGIKWDFAAMSLTGAIFQNEQTRADRDNVTGEQFEIRGLEITGLEIQLQGQILDPLYITAGYTYLHGETASGVEPRELPENMFSFWGQYQFNPKIGFGAGVIFQDDSLISDGGSAILPSYYRVDAAAYYALSKEINLQVNIENLTDETYYPNAHATHQATVGKPLNAMFTISGVF